MKYSTYILFTVVAALAAATSDIGIADAANAPANPIGAPGRVVPGNCPSGVRQRKEIRALSVAERDAFINALKKLQARPDNGGPSRYDLYAKLHNDNAPFSHGSAAFLPWHRRFLRELEIDLQKIDASVMLPFWDWRIDSQAPETSIVFSKEYFGGNGDHRGCITDGPFADAKPYYMQPNCIQRRFDYKKNIGAFYSPEAIQSLINNSKDFSTFSVQLEGTCHARVHNGIGGGMLNMYSPSDPLFFMHHTMIDRIWWQWQTAKQGNAVAFNGGLRNGSQATPNTIIEPWNDLAVKDMFRIESLCYTYGELPANKVEKRPESEKPPVTIPADKKEDKKDDKKNDKKEDKKDDKKEKKDDKKEKKDDKKDDKEDKKDDKKDNKKDKDDKKEDKKEDKEDKKDDKKDNKKDKDDKEYKEELKKPTTNAPVTPDGNNRESLTKIRIPPPTPEEWLKHNYQPVEVIRKVESSIKDNVYDKLNSIHGYISPAALANREDVISKLVASGQKVFTAGFGTERVPVTIANSTATVKDAVKNIRNKVATYVTKSPLSTVLDVFNPSSIINKVTAIIGTPQQAGVSPTSASNYESFINRDFTHGWVPVTKPGASDDDEDCEDEDVYEDCDDVVDDDEDCDDVADDEEDCEDEDVYEDCEENDGGAANNNTTKDDEEDCEDEEDSGYKTNSTTAAAAASASSPTKDTVAQTVAQVAQAIPELGAIIGNMH